LTLTCLVSRFLLLVAAAAIAGLVLLRLALGVVGAALGLALALLAWPVSPLVAWWRRWHGRERPEVSLGRLVP
jgi:uncharacterized membrane protein YccC